MFKKLRGKIKQRWDGYKIRKGWLPRGRTHARKPGAVQLGGNLPSKLRYRGSISARVIRKDGTIEDLGVIARSESKGDKHG